MTTGGSGCDLCVELDWHMSLYSLYMYEQNKEKDCIVQSDICSAGYGIRMKASNWDE